MIYFSEPRTTEIDFKFIETYEAKCLLLGKPFRWQDILYKIISDDVNLVGVLTVDDCVIYSYYKRCAHLSLLQRDTQYIIINPTMQDLSYSWEYNDVGDYWCLRTRHSISIPLSDLLKKFRI